MPRQRRDRLSDLDAKVRSGAAQDSAEPEAQGSWALRRALDPGRRGGMCSDATISPAEIDLCGFFARIDSPSAALLVSDCAKALRDGFFTFYLEIFEFFSI